MVLETYAARTMGSRFVQIACDMPAKYALRQPQLSRLANHLFDVENERAKAGKQTTDDHLRQIASVWCKTRLAADRQCAAIADYWNQHKTMEGFSLT